MTELNSLQEILGISFQNTSYLEQALIHRSCLNETSDASLESNERLEFLGDALLGLAVAEELFRQFPDFPEGELTMFRSSLVQTDTLAKVAHSLHLGEYLSMGKGEEETGGKDKRRNLACTLEAVTGAVLLDQGFEKASQFALRILNEEFEKITENLPGKDSKTKLQEVTQSQKQLLPSYTTTNISGPEHAREFTVEVYVDGIFMGQGTGMSKRGAEQEAAKVALQKLEGEPLA